MGKKPRGSIRQNSAPAQQKEPNAAASGVIAALVATLRANLQVAIGTAVLGLFAAVGFWLTPLKDIVMHRLYPERARIELIADRLTISGTQPLEVQLKISQLSTTPVSKGVARLHFDSDLLALAPESSSVANTGEITGTTLLEKRFVLFPAEAKANDGKAATAQLRATLETKFNKYESEPLAINIVAMRQAAGPFIEKHGSQAINLSGEWHIEIGGAHGNMRIKQEGLLIKGLYSLNGQDGATDLAVDGYKDGTTFKVFLYRDKAGTRRWRIDSNFAINNVDKRFVEIKGCAFSIERDASIVEDSAVEASANELSCGRPRNYVGWRGVGASRFYATAQFR